MRFDDLEREETRQSWNAATRAHQSHQSGMATYLCRGGSTLFPEERELLGQVGGLDLVHLQCNAGADSLSLARLCARVTGVDLSDAAIDAARALSSATGIAAEFVRADMYDWLAERAASGDSFDIAFSSYGALCWLADLPAWAHGVARILRPGGQLVVVDFHPVAAMFDAGWQHAYPYGGGRRQMLEDGVGDYVGAAGGGLSPSGFAEGVRDFRNPHRAVLYQWGVGEIVSALADAGLVVTTLREYPWSNGERNFDDMCELPGRRMLPPARVPELPLMFGVVARKPA